MIYEDGTYLVNNPTWHEEDSPWKAMQIVKILRKNDIIPKTICEIGCGAGGVLDYLSKEYDNNIIYSGYEISPQAYQLSKPKENTRLKFFLANLLERQEKDFDVVLSLDVFEHVEDYLGFLRLLKEKGKYKIFNIPLDLSIQMVLRVSPLLNLRHSVGHLHYFSKDTALATLRDAGYEILDYFYVAPTQSSVQAKYYGVSTHQSKLSKNWWKVNVMRILRGVFFFINQDLTVRILGGYSLTVLAR
jgi:cyclopropane fatty-acyl-phospholipid synthase-like methyltransferase